MGGSLSPVSRGRADCVVGAIGVSSGDRDEGGGKPVGSVAIARAARIALNKAIVEMDGRLQKQLDRHPRARPWRTVEIRCECDDNDCAARIQVHRAIFLEREGHGQQWFVAAGHTRAAGNQVVYTARGYQLVEACPHPRKFFWSTDPWS